MGLRQVKLLQTAMNVFIIVIVLTMNLIDSLERQQMQLFNIAYSKFGSLAVESSGARKQRSGLFAVNTI